MVESPRKPKRRVLIAEDVRAIWVTMCNALESEGYLVQVAQDGEECLELVRNFKPELVLMDVMMPKIHGIEVMRKLREDEGTRDLGVIVCTAKQFLTECREFEELGATDVIFKPFKRVELIEKVNRFFSDEKKAPINSEYKEASSVLPYRPVFDADGIAVRLWGTRGSIPVSGVRYLRHGGNTTCMGIRQGDEQIIFDAGSGIREIGIQLAQEAPCRIHLFVTHTHWDHIQGFPFFFPAYIPGFDITIYGGKGFDEDLESLFRGQLKKDYFPVQLEDMQASLKFVRLDEDPVRIGDARITWEFTNHPLPTVGYKYERAGRSIVFIPDNEFLQSYQGAPADFEKEDDLVAPFMKIVEFATGADVLYHEAQFTNQEYGQKIGWGHCSVSNACILAKMTGVMKWVIVHHDPGHDDEFLDRKLNMTRLILSEIECDTEVVHGYDGMELVLPSRKAAADASPVMAPVVSRTIAPRKARTK